MSERRLGIVRSGHALLFGWGHGFGMWLPDRVQHLIVHAWNVVACIALGHGTLTQDEPGGRVGCVNCMRAVRDPGDGVLRLWDIPWEDPSA